LIYKRRDAGIGKEEMQATDCKKSGKYAGYNQ
jgi:hypothetical protein